HRHAEEADDVEAEDLLDQLVIQLLAATVVHPGEELRAVTAEHRAGAEQRSCPMLSVPVRGNRMGTIQDAVMDRILNLERLDDRTCRQEVDLEAAARHLGDPVDEL